MATLLGLAITGLTSGAGILSRKASVRLVTNPDFIKIAKLFNKQGTPVYNLAEMEKLTPEQLKEFAKIAGIKDVQIIEGYAHEKFRYEQLADFIQHPSFKELKAFSDIQVNGEHVYADWINGLCTANLTLSKLCWQMHNKLLKKIKIFIRKLMR